MPTLQSPGIGSGLDVNGLVTQLVNAEKQPGANRITKEKTAIGTEISALGLLKGALSSFNATLDPLKTVESFSARTATSSDEDVFTTSASTAAVPGDYNVRVVQLAKAQQIASTPFGSTSTVVGTGALVISLAGNPFTVNIDSSKSTLAGIRDAINSEPTNLGVKATIVQANDGAHLVLTSAKTGLSNKITLSTTSTDGLANLSYNPPTNASHYSELTPAQDSIITIAGFSHGSASNVVTDAIDGVTFNLKSESKVGETQKLSVAANTSAAAARIKNFVSQYNATYNQLNDLGKYDAATGKAGPLIGDPLIRSVISEMRRGVSDTVSGLSGNATALARIGITTGKDGTLQIDESKLNAALSTNFDGVGKLFGSETGIAARMSKLITARLDSKGEIATRNQSLDKRTKAVAQRQAELDTHMAKLESIYRAQFSALDAAMAKMQSTSSYLSQQLANLPKTS